MKTSVSNRAIADPLVVSQHEVVLVGREPGKTTRAITDNTGKELDLEIQVKSEQKLDSTREDSSKNPQPEMGDKFPPVPIAVVGLKECKIERVIDLQVARPKMFTMKDSLIRTYLSDGDVADLYPTNNGRQIYLLGKKAGRTKLFLWDKAGNESGIDLRVMGQPSDHNDTVTIMLPDECAHPSTQQEASPGTGQATKSPTTTPNSRNRNPDWQIEYWTGNRKCILTCPAARRTGKALFSQLLQAGRQRIPGA
jgi:Flp pilus assembly secretin CpaC